MNNQRTYPAYFKASNALVAVMNDTTSLVAFKGGGIQVQQNAEWVLAAFEFGETTTKEIFDRQLEANNQLIEEFKKLLCP